MNLHRSPGFSLALLLSMGPVPAQDRKDAYTDPKEAGPDFLIQGEYTGDFDGPDGKKKLGVQVIALGEGKFKAVALRGGLPGDGWDGSKKVEVEARAAADGKPSFPGLLGNAAIRDGVLTITSPEGKVLAELKRIERKSPTLGKKPPAGATVLFDGTSARNFEEKDHITKDGLLTQGSNSVEQLQGVSLHLEFQTSFMPRARGQGRSNSGCYLQARYEVQILDSFGLQGTHDECGGIYTVAPPRVNMCFPPLSWQTYDIEFTPAAFDSSGKKVADAVMTVHHNGVLIHENVKVDHATTAAPLKEGPTPGHLHLQDHGNPVRFRNIWLVKKGGTP